MSEIRSGSAERRAFPRYEISIPFDLTVQINGTYQARIGGRTLNLCRGGLRAIVDEELPAGMLCLVQFPEPTGLTPQFRSGRVVRGRREPANYEIAVQFDRFPWLRASNRVVAANSDGVERQPLQP